MKILIGILAENFLPRSPGTGRNIQLFQHFGLKQSLGYGLFKELLRGGTIIAHAVPGSGLILHLHHNYGVPGVGLFQVPHEFGEGTGIGFHGSGCMR